MMKEKKGSFGVLLQCTIKNELPKPTDIVKATIQKAGATSDRWKAYVLNSSITKDEPKAPKILKLLLFYN